MNRKLRSTVAGFSAAALFALFAFGVSTPTAPDTDATKPAMGAEELPTRARAVSPRSRYTMPYFSFARLLPRRES